MPPAGILMFCPRRGCWWNCAPLGGSRAPPFGGMRESKPCPPAGGPLTSAGGGRESRRIWRSSPAGPHRHHVHCGDQCRWSTPRAPEASMASTVVSWAVELPDWYRSNGHRAPARQVCAPVVAARAEEQIVVGRSREGSLGDTRAGRAGNLGAVDERGLEPDEYCRRP